MKTWMITAGFLLGLLVITGFVIAANLDSSPKIANKSETKAVSSGCSGCSGSCTAEKNCGQAGCSAVTSGKCSCGEGCSCGGSGSCGNPSCTAKTTGSCSCGKK